MLADFSLFFSEHRIEQLISFTHSNLFRSNASELCQHIQALGSAELSGLSLRAKLLFQDALLGAEEAFLQFTRAYDELYVWETRWKNNRSGLQEALTNKFVKPYNPFNSRSPPKNSNQASTGSLQHTRTPPLLILSAFSPQQPHSTGNINIMHGIFRR